MQAEIDEVKQAEIKATGGKISKMESQVMEQLAELKAENERLKGEAEEHSKNMDNMIDDQKNIQTQFNKQIDDIMEANNKLEEGMKLRINEHKEALDKKDKEAQVKAQMQEILNQEILKAISGKEYFLNQTHNE